MTVHPAVLGVALFGRLTSVLGPARSTAGPVVTIEVFDFDFGNASTGQHVDPTIAVGDTVRWQFVTGLHSTVSVQGTAEAWDSGTVLPGASFAHTFTNPGTFAY
jgi:plastocyanin